MTGQPVGMKLSRPWSSYVVCNIWCVVVLVVCVVADERRLTM